MLSSHGMQHDEVVQKGADFNTVALGTSPSSDLPLDLFFCPCVSLLYQRGSGEKKNVRLTRIRTLPHCPLAKCRCVVSVFQCVTETFLAIIYFIYYISYFLLVAYHL